jgi:CRP-like cAMP-binding protein
MLTLPVAHVEKGETELVEALAGRQAFGALVLDGMLLQRLRLADQEAMRLIGPGDVIAVEPPLTPSLVEQLGRRAISDVRLALLGHDFLAAARRWPGLIAALHVRAAEQAERVGAQVVICQLSRVADRLLAMMWLLADSWGRVTSAGVMLPVLLTHEALGELIGARRPTVSLALAELIERGAVVRQQSGWLLLEGPAEVAVAAAPAEPPVLLDDAGTESRWSGPPPPAPTSHTAIGSELLDTVLRLRDEVGRARDAIGRTLDDVRSNRERIRVRREERAAGALSSRQAPSSR